MYLSKKVRRVVGVSLLVMGGAVVPSQAQDAETLYRTIAKLETSLREAVAEERAQRDEHLDRVYVQMQRLQSTLEAEAQEQADTVAAAQALFSEMQARQTALRAAYSASESKFATLRREVEALATAVAELRAPQHTTSQAQDTQLLADLHRTVDALAAYLDEIRPVVDRVQAERWSIAGEVRHRSASDARRPSITPNTEHLLRTRLAVAFQPSADFSGFVQVQDARTFGSGNPAYARGTLDASADALDLHQAYVDVQGLLGASTTVRLGRQEVALGNQRLVGSLGWSNVGRSFDAIRVNYAQPASGFLVTAFGARLVQNQEGTQNLTGMYATWLAHPSHTLDAFAFHDTEQAYDIGQPSALQRLRRTTAGARAYGQHDAWQYDAEGIYQFGTAQPEAVKLNIQAYLFSAKVGRHLHLGRPVTASVHYTVLSGDGQPGDDTERTFNTLFATNHAFYGMMDYFPATYTTSGLQDVAVSLHTAINAKTAVRMALHWFSTAVPVGGPDAGARALGHELDLRGTHTFRQHLDLEAGVALFRTTDLMEAAIGRSFTTFGYLMTRIRL